MVPGTPLVTVPVVGSIVAPSVGTGLNAKVPPASPVIVAVPPSHVSVVVNEALAVVKTVTSWVLLEPQAPEIVYSIVYVTPDVPPVIVPVVESIVAPSVGTGLNVKTPPASPVIVTVPPSQVGVAVNEGFDVVKAVTSSVFVSGQEPIVVYSMV
jgi:hypothetical protein